MATNDYVDSYLRQSMYNTPQYNYSYGLVDPGMAQANSTISGAWQQNDMRKNIEWANKQKMYDPAYWAQAFSGNSSGNTLGSLMSPQNFNQSDAYKWNFEQGREAVNRTAAAKRMLGSGNRLSELTKFGQGLASQEYGNEFNRQLALKQLENDNRRMNMQSSMQMMQSIPKIAPQIGGW